MFHAFLRAIQLLARKKNGLRVLHFEIDGSDETNEFFGNKITLKFRLKNAIWLQFDKHRLVIRQNGWYTIQLPIQAEQNQISIRIQGILSSWHHTIRVSNQAPTITPLHFKQIELTTNLSLPQISIARAKTVPSFKSMVMSVRTATPRIKLTKPAIHSVKNPSMISTEELNKELTENLISNI